VGWLFVAFPLFGVNYILEAEPGCNLLSFLVLLETVVRSNPFDDPSYSATPAEVSCAFSMLLGVVVPLIGYADPNMLAFVELRVLYLVLYVAY
jgi:hypothetical protein